ncbi:MAG: hypothetical protein R3E98_08275 [Gemmatimonadota bacterium]|nr:hypothetical protein [Gemmatimonadota bacterium]
MPRPPGALVVRWRDMAAEGKSYAEISRRFPKYSADQVRHYCLGNSGASLPGPRQEPGRWGGHNVWLQGEKSPHAEMSKAQALRVLNDWDEKKDAWRRSGAEWAEKLGVSPSTIHMLRRGETWKHLEHPNQGRKPKRKSAGKAEESKAAAPRRARKATRKKSGAARKQTSKASKRSTSTRKTSTRAKSSRGKRR